MKAVKIIIFLSSLFLSSAEKVAEQNEKRLINCKVSDFQRLATV